MKILQLLTFILFLSVADAYAQFSSEYSRVAAENQSTYLSVPADIAYGANGRFAYKFKSYGNVRWDNAAFGDPIPGIVKSGYVRSFIYACNENQSKYFATPVAVAYGHGEQWSFKDGMAGQISFNNQTFGDPKPGTVKAGYYLPYNEVASENGSYYINGVADVAYGTQGKFVFKYNVSGNINFNNATFGDPTPGVVKQGFVRIH